MNQCCICIYHICCIICYIQLIIYCTTPQSGSTHMSRKPIPLPLFDVPQPCPGMNCGSIYLFTQNTVICFYYMGKKKKKNLFCFFCLWNESFLRMTSSLNFYVLINPLDCVSGYYDVFIHLISDSASINGQHLKAHLTWHFEQSWEGKAWIWYESSKRNS